MDDPWRCLKDTLRGKVLWEMRIREGNLRDRPLVLTELYRRFRADYQIQRGFFPAMDVRSVYARPSVPWSEENPDQWLSLPVGPNGSYAFEFSEHWHRMKKHHPRFPD